MSCYTYSFHFLQSLKNLLENSPNSILLYVGIRVIYDEVYLSDHTSVYLLANEHELSQEIDIDLTSFS